MTVYAACVVAASLIPTPGGLAATGPLGAVGLDAWFHVAGYTGLGALGADALPGRTRRTFVVAVCLAVGLGAGVEVMQTALPYRSFDVWDCVANAVGATLGAGGWYLLAARRSEATE